MIPFMESKLIARDRFTHPLKPIRMTPISPYYSRDFGREWDMPSSEKVETAGSGSEGSFDWAERGEFERLMEEVRAGSQDAAWELLERIGPHVHRVVHRMINREIRGRFDSLDFVQAVWASFFVNRRQISSFSRPEQLIRFLVVMARNKVMDEHRRLLTTEKHDVRREKVSVQDLHAIEESPIPQGASPSQFAIARECWQRMLEGQPELHRQIVYRRYMGDTHEEIAATLGINRRTITRVLERMLLRASA